MKKILIFALVCLLVSCGQSTQPTDTVTKEEYDKVVEERDYYKNLYEESQSVISETDQSVLDVELTVDNFSEYFEITPVVTTYFEGTEYEETYMFFYPKSKLYEDGWIYRECNANFQMKVDDPYGERVTYFNARAFGEDGYIVDIAEENPVKIISIEGIARFERKESCLEYSWDTFKARRIVRFSDGKYFNDGILQGTEDMPY